AHPTVPAALCIQNPVTDKTTMNFTLDLVGGNLGTGTAPLPMLDHVLYSAPTDPTGIVKFEVDFSPAGEATIWSARAVASGPQIVNWQLLDDPGSRMKIVDNVAHWQVSRDGTSWYWLQGFNYSTTGADSGTLQSAPYPAGTPVTTIAANIGEYTQVGAKSMVVRAGLNQSAGDLKLIGDIGDVAGTTKTLDTGVVRIWDLSADGTTALYSKTNTGQLFDMYLASLSKPMPCALSSTPLALGFGHLAVNTLTAAWVKVLGQTDQGAFYTTFDQCTTRQFATNIATFSAVGDQGYVYEDESSATAAEATLRFNQVVAGMLKTKGTVVQTQAYPTAAVLWPAHAAVVFSVATNGSTDGLYVNATLPFTGLTPPPGFIPAPTDGGASEGGAAVEAGPDLPPAIDAGTPETPADDSGAGDAGAGDDGGG
ncbi:MAG TPA: hypothetical protein VMU50_21340, partial [Polyangia bacterium]|nr:hypothetical protein [Polyangia bacterium]